VKAIGVSGSPRKGGNSEALLGEALRAARDLGARTEMVRLAALRYTGCTQCRACLKAGRCTRRDGLAGLYGKLRDADIWIFSTPIYYDGVSGQMKSFFDRLWCFTQKGNNLEGRRAGAIVAACEAKSSPFYGKVLESMAAYFNWFGKFDPVRTLCAGGLGPRGAAKRCPGALARAGELGEFLINGLAGGRRKR